MSRRLPPLAALRAFEAAGRHLSFSKAGEELLVSQSAISHHIQTLETSLGVPLFVRRTRAVSLTPEGAGYLATVRQAFDLLVAGTDAVAAVSANGVGRAATQALRPRISPTSA